MTGELKHDDLAHDPSIRQIVQSPGNTMEERWDARAVASEPPQAQASRTLGRPRGLFKSLLVVATRAPRSRR